MDICLQMGCLCAQPSRLEHQTQCQLSALRGRCGGAPVFEKNHQVLRIGASLEFVWDTILWFLAGDSGHGLGWPLQCDCHCQGPKTGGAPSLKDGSFMCILRSLERPLTYAMMVRSAGTSMTWMSPRWKSWNQRVPLRCRIFDLLTVCSSSSSR